MTNTKITANKILIGLMIALAVGLFTGCYEGFIGDDGQPLRTYNSYPTLKAYIEDSDPDMDIWIIDVRPSAQYALGHIPSALSKPSGYITTLPDEDLYDELPLDQYLIFYCESGIRAQAVVTYLIEKGYTKIMNWGSVTRWRGDLE